MIQPRQAVLTLQPYVAPEEGRGDKIRLDFNENTSGILIKVNPLAASSLVMYPEYTAFVEALAAFLELPTDWLLLTNGSDEGLFLIATTFIEPNQDAALISTPTFQMIPHYLHLAQADIRDVPALPDLTYDVPALEQELSRHPKLAMFASPNNPTGATLPEKVIASWCHAFPNTLFAMDEAYVEYAMGSALCLIQTCPNLLVVRTFSKAWGLAGVRLGYIVGQPALIELIRRVQSPYSVNTFAVTMAAELLMHHQDVLMQAQATMKRKENVLQTLQSMGYRVYPGEANFFLLFMGVESDAFCTFCETQGVLLRNRSTLPGMQGLIRISVGTDEEMQTFLDCLRLFQAQRALIFDLDDTLIDTTQSFTWVVQTMVEQHSGSPLSLK